MIGQVAPDFTLPSSTGHAVTLSALRGQKVVLFFYPKDSTPACTQEACDFRDSFAQFAAHGVAVFGINLDEAKSHEKFRAKQQLPYELLTDVDHQVCESYGVWQLKKLYGKEYMGIVRSTFLIDEEGIVVQEWRNLKVKGHVEQVLASLG